MPQLIVRQIEAKVVKKPKEKAGEHGVSMARRILRKALLGPLGEKPSFKEYLLQMPDVGTDDLLERSRDMGREVDLTA